MQPTVRDNVHSAHCPAKVALLEQAMERLALAVHGMDAGLASSLPLVAAGDTRASGEQGRLCGSASASCSAECKRCERLSAALCRSAPHRPNTLNRAWGSSLSCSGIPSSPLLLSASRGPVPASLSCSISSPRLIPPACTSSASESPAMEAAIEKAFKETGNFVFREKDALQQCRQLADGLGLNPADLAKHYDVFSAMRWAFWAC
jgi:hypothetical protein